MYRYCTKDFVIFMSLKFEVEVDKAVIGEESVLLYMEELDKNIVSKLLLDITPRMVLMHSYVYDTEENEWIVCVASDADTNYPLFLICLKDGEKIYEEILKTDSTRGEK